MTSEVNDVGQEYESLVRHRYTLLATHVVLGLLSGLVLLSHEQSSHGLSAAVRHFFASWPYLLSGVVCYQREGLSALKLVLFQLVLIAGTGLGALVYLGHTGLPSGGFTITGVTLAQAWTFINTARLLMPRELSDFDSPYQFR